ncbi:MAG: GNAT family N-acetyltransferase [Actinomycetota bacterium]
MPLLLILRGRGPLRIAESAGRGISDYTELRVDSPEEAESAVVGIVEDPRWNAVALNNVVKTSPTATLARSLARSRGWLIFELATNVAPRVRLEGSWEDFYRTKRERKARHNLDRALRRLQEVPGFEVTHHHESHDVEAALVEAFALDAANPKGVHGRWAFSGDLARPFYREVARRFAERRWFELSMMRAAGGPLAFAYSFVWEGTYYYYKARAAVNDPLSRFSPGAVLLKLLLERSFDQGLTRFDLMLGDEPYKAAWATEHDPVGSMYLARRGSANAVAWWTLKETRRLRERARRSARLRGLVARGIRVIGR